MRFVLTYLRFHRNALTVVAVLVLAALLLSLLNSLRPVEERAVLLGNSDAPRQGADERSAPAHPANPAPRPIAASLATDVREATRDWQPSAHHEAPLRAALDCARSLAGLPTLTHDPALAQEAAALWQAMVARPDVTLTNLARDRYVMVAVVPLALAAEPSENSASQASPCAFGDSDMAQFDLSGITTIGVAVFPDPQPADGLDDSSAIIVAR